MQTNPSKIIIYTDGSALGNPGPGGYGIVMMYGKHRKTFSQGFRNTTNNRMELLAVIEALKKLKTNQIPIEIYTDSKYVSDAVEKRWIDGWERKQFKKVKNPDLWIEFLRIYRRFNVKFIWVKGHANNPLNELADQLAVEGSNSPNHLVDKGYEEQQLL